MIIIIIIRQYAKWGKDGQDPDWGGLKAPEQERRPSFGDLKVSSACSSLKEIEHFDRNNRVYPPKMYPELKLLFYINLHFISHCEMGL